MLELKMSEQTLKNLYSFLDRAEIKGHAERRAMNEIEQMLGQAKPVEERREEEKEESFPKQD